MSKVRKPAPPSSDLVYEIQEALENQKREIEWLLENLSDKGKPLSKRQREIIKGSLVMLFRDQAEEGVVMYCFGDSAYGLDTLQNLIVRMQRFEEVLA